jgi:hypothetical protein
MFVSKLAKLIRRHSSSFPGHPWSVIPVSTSFGFDRGTPIRRYYIDSFLERYSSDITGKVLEVSENTYTAKFGREVTQSDVLHVCGDAPGTTVVGNLEDPATMPQGAYDCAIFTQTLHCIYDMKTAVKSMFSCVRPGGVVLVTVPGISQISRYDMDRWGDYWRLTSLSARRLFDESFPQSNITVETFGNVLTAAASLHGFAAEEVSPADMAYKDPDYEVLIGVRAMRPAQKQ